MKTSHLIIAFLLFFSLFQSSAQQCYNTTYSGEGTFYDGVAGSSAGNCSLPVAEGDYFHCALNNIQYDNSNACGACVTVTGPKGSIVLKVVDRCPECASGDIDMTEEAFSQIADVIDGRVPITWTYTTCESNKDDDIKIVFKEGSSDSWTAIQFRNTTHGIASMEYQDANGNWISVSRALYNFFVATSGIPSPMNLRITSALEEQVVFENITLINSVEINTGKQFSTPNDCEDSTLDVENFKLNTHRILTSNNFYVTTFKSQSEIFDSNKIHLFNLGGQKINIQTTLEDENTIRVNTESLASGVYIIKIEEDKNSVLTKKIIIQ